MHRASLIMVRRIPPEYANRDTKQLDKGRVVDRKDGFDTDKKKFRQEGDCRRKGSS